MVWNERIMSQRVSLGRLEVIIAIKTIEIKMKQIFIKKIYNYSQYFKKLKKIILLLISLIYINKKDGDISGS